MSQEQEPKTRVIKIIYPHKCPHCSNDIMLSVRIPTPSIDWVLRKEDIATAKDKVKKAINESNIPEEEKTNVTKWIDSDETLFGPEEVQQIIEQILINQEEEK